ncbi:hypothetical protein Fmac_029942 [Flemingia macrophylla]|uniref:Uncharacterized protein n=1 Tax=Flemingia macrophylla TaxID=520843 RepID=A0ABD1LCC3_9FABA
MLQMETLVVVAQHRNQYCSRSKPQGHTSPSRDFNRRAFQTGCGILPTPLTSPLTKHHPSSDSSKTPSITNKTRCKTTPTSAPLPINHKRDRGFSEHVSDGAILLSELWAGPTYSNSPPPSSLPIPKFFAKPKRSVSLDLPGSCPEVEMQFHAKSAPSSPRREDSPFAEDIFDSATMNLRRILNLNLDDE